MDAREAIRAQFMVQYMKKDFAAITVKGLCAGAPVARTTFYSYYRNTDEVRQEIEDDLIRGLLDISERIAASNYPDMDFFLFMDETETYIREHWSEIDAFLVRQPNLRFICKWKEAIKTNFRRRYPEKQQLNHAEAIAEIVASSVISAYTCWMENPQSTDVREIKPILHKLLDSLVSFL